MYQADVRSLVLSKLDDRSICSLACMCRDFHTHITTLQSCSYWWHLRCKNIASSLQLGLENVDWQHIYYVLDSLDEEILARFDRDFLVIASSIGSYALVKVLLSDEWLILSDRALSEASLNNHPEIVS